MAYYWHHLADCWPSVPQGLIAGSSSPCCPPKLSSAKLQEKRSSWPQSFLLQSCRTLHLPLLTLTRFSWAHFSSLLRSLWTTVIPPLYQSLSQICNHPRILWKCTLFYNPDCYENLTSIGLFVPLTTSLWAYQPSHFFTHLFSLYLSSSATRMFWEIFQRPHADQEKHPEF